MSDVKHNRMDSDKLKAFAETIMRLRYDSVMEFFIYCRDEIEKQANGDMRNGRPLLGSYLYMVAHAVNFAVAFMGRADKICKPHYGCTKDGE